MSSQQSCFPKNLAISSAVMLLLVWNSFPSAAQESPRGNAGVTGRVTATVMMEVNRIQVDPTVADVSARLFHQADSVSQIHLNGSATSSETILTVEVLLRTNTTYELSGELLRSGSAPMVTVNVKGMHPTGSLVCAGARADMKLIRPSAELSTAPIEIARGPRISMGTRSSPRNAISLELEFHVSSAAGAAWSSDILLTIKRA